MNASGRKPERWAQQRSWPRWVVLTSVSAVALVGALMGHRPEPRAAPPPVKPPVQGFCGDCPGNYYQGDIYDLHIHLPLAGCGTGDPALDCDVALQQLFLDGLLPTGDMPNLGVVHAALQAAANDNTVELGGAFTNVFTSTRDAERRNLAALYPELSPILGGFDAEDPSAKDYVDAQLTVPGNPWKGVGEVHLRSKAYERQTAADFLSFVDVCKKAAAAGVPVFIHWDPRYPPGASYLQTIDEIRSLLSNAAFQAPHPTLKLVWFHHGHHQCDNSNDCTIPGGPACQLRHLSPCVTDLLDTYTPANTSNPDLYLGWEFDDESLFLDSSGSLDQLGLALQQYPDQIVIASDIGVRKGLRRSWCLDPPYPPGTSSWRCGAEFKSPLYMENLICIARRVLYVLDQALPGAADKIAFLNAQRLGFP